MPIDLNNLTYPFDPTGAYTSNKVTGEQQTITGANFRDFHFIVPRWAPFFAEGLVISFRDLNNDIRILVEGVDYYCTHWFISASRACAKPIYGSITFLDTELTGVVTLEYQTLGGVWNIDEELIATILANVIQNPRETAWDEVSEMPTIFPPIDHEWDLIDLVGMTEVNETLLLIRDAILQAGNSNLSSHLANVNNPHSTTKAQVGLGNVANYAPASNPQSLAGASTTTYMTPYGTKLLITQEAITPLSNHLIDANNPHHVTVAQLGTYTSAEIDALIAAKVDEGADAPNAIQFGGYSVTGYRDYVIAQLIASNTAFVTRTELSDTLAMLTTAFEDLKTSLLIS